MVVGAFTVETDVAVIGAGAAGIAAALSAAAHGRSVTLIDQRPLPGGARLDFSVRGRLLSQPPTSLSALRSSWTEAIDAAAAPMIAALSEAGISFVCGAVRFESVRDLAISDNPQVPRLHSRRTVIATGSGEPGDLLALLDHAEEGQKIRLSATPAGIECAVLLAAAGAESILLCGPIALPAAARDQLLELLQSAGIAYDRSDSAPSADPSPLAVERAGVRRDAQGYVDRTEGVRTSEPRVLVAGAAASQACDLRSAILEGRAAGDLASGEAAALVLPTARQFVLRAPMELAWCGEDETSEDLITTEMGRVRIFAEARGGLVRGARANGPFAQPAIDVITAAIEMGAVTEDLEVLLAAAT